MEKKFSYLQKRRRRENAIKGYKLQSSSLRYGLLTECSKSLSVEKLHCTVVQHFSFQIHAVMWPPHYTKFHLENCRCVVASYVDGRRERERGGGARGERETIIGESAASIGLETIIIFGSIQPAAQRRRISTQTHSNSSNAATAATLILEAVADAAATNYLRNALSLSLSLLFYVVASRGNNN